MLPGWEQERTHRLADPPTVKLRPGYSKWLLVRIPLDTTTRTYRPPTRTDIASVGIRSTVAVEREERKFWTVLTTGDRRRATIDNGEPVIVRSVRHSQRAGYPLEWRPRAAHRRNRVQLPCDRVGDSSTSDDFESLGFDEIWTCATTKERIASKRLQTTPLGSRSDAQQRCSVL